MANVLNKTADPADYRTSVNDPEYPTVDWFHNPDLSAVVGVPRQYWARPLTDPVTEMTQGEKDAVDAADAAARVTRNRADAVAAPDNTEQAIGWETRALIELLNKRDNFLTTRIIELQDALIAMKASSGNVAALRDAIPASYLGTSTRPRADAVQDYKDDINSGGADS